MRINVSNATIITMKQSEYEFNGKSGISYKADILVDDSVEKFSLSQEAYEILEIGKKYNLFADLYLGNNRCSVKIIGIAK